MHVYIYGSLRVLHALIPRKTIPSPSCTDNHLNLLLGLKMTKHHQGLDSQQIQFFMQHGYVKIEGAFTRSQAAEMTKDLWTRLGMRPDDKQTWDREWINMPGLSSQPTAELQAQTSDQLLALNRYAVKDFSPRAWAAICDLVVSDRRVNFRS